MELDPVVDRPPESGELLPLEALEPFGWIFTPGPLPAHALSREDALHAAGLMAAGGEIGLTSGVYTEKGRYREEGDGRRVTLYAEQPVWAITFPPAARDGRETPGGHTLIDALSGQILTQFLQGVHAVELQPLDLYTPLGPAVLSREAAVAAAVAGEERVLTGLPREVEYGARRRPIPGFVQVGDVWRVTFDTSGLPPRAPDAPPEAAWVVLVDDKAGHRWLSAAVAARPGGSPTG